MLHQRGRQLVAPQLSAGKGDYTSLSFSPDGTPYVAYQDGGNTGFRAHGRG